MKTDNNKIASITIIGIRHGVNQKGKLQLSPIDINPEYREEWQIREHDFVCLTRDGELVNDSLFRVGGIGDRDVDKHKYFMLIRHKEAFYSKDIMRMSKSKTNKHLSGHWCILNDKGEIKFEAESFQNPYLVGGCIYTYKNGYYNIDTGYCYAASVHKTVSSDNFLCLENNYDKDLTKKGIVKIDKRTGLFEIL